MCAPAGLRARIALVWITVLLTVAEAVSPILAAPGDPAHAPVGPAQAADGRRRDKSDRSTSSESGDRTEGESTGGGYDDSLGLDLSESSSGNSKESNKKYMPKSSKERKGWRKWHRRCTPCPEDARLTWRDPRVQWVCGAYQRARRSFKSECMMHYRNCQDGTMFVKIHEHRCANSSRGDERPRGEHFFYDYKAVLSGDDSSETSRKSSSVESSSSSGETRRRLGRTQQRDTGRAR